MKSEVKSFIFDLLHYILRSEDCLAGHGQQGPPLSFNGMKRCLRRPMDHFPIRGSSFHTVSYTFIIYYYCPLTFTYIYSFHHGVWVYNIYAPRIIYNKISKVWFHLSFFPRVSGRICYRVYLSFSLLQRQQPFFSIFIFNKPSSVESFWFCMCVDDIWSS